MGRSMYILYNVIQCSVEKGATFREDEYSNNTNNNQSKDGRRKSI